MVRVLLWSATGTETSRIGHPDHPIRPRLTATSAAPIHQRMPSPTSSTAGRQPDEPQNYHTLTYDLDEDDGVTTVSLTQDNASSPDEAKHDAENWSTMLAGLKAEVEGA